MLAGYFPCCASCKGAGGRRGAHPINSHPLFQPLPRPKKHTPAPQTAKLTSLALFREGSGFLQPPSPRILTYLLFSFFSPSVLFRISAAAAEAYCNGREEEACFPTTHDFPLPPCLPSVRMDGEKKRGIGKGRNFKCFCCAESGECYGRGGGGLLLLLCYCLRNIWEIAFAFSSTLALLFKWRRGNFYELPSLLQLKGKGKEFWNFPSF